MNFKISLQTYLKQTNLEKKPSIKIQVLEENTMFCSKILGETFIFNWGDRWDFNTLIWLGLAWLDLVLVWVWFRSGLFWLGLA